MGIKLSLQRIEDFVERSGFKSLEEFAENYEINAEKRIIHVLGEMGIWGLVKTQRKSLVPHDKLSVKVTFGSYLNETLSLRFLMNAVLKMFIVDKPYKHKVRFYVEMNLTWSGVGECDGIEYTFYYH